MQPDSHTEAPLTDHEKRLIDLYFDEHLSLFDICDALACKLPDLTEKLANPRIAYAMMPT